jgi:hypothetical protein
VVDFAWLIIVVRATNYISDPGKIISLRKFKTLKRVTFPPFHIFILPV